MEIHGQGGTQKANARVTGQLLLELAHLLLER